METIEIKRVLISVSDKTGIEEFAQALNDRGCEIISTGGTKKVLENADIMVTDIAQVTGNPEAFGGRMKTLSFQIESALLFDREQDAAEAAELGIKPIDMVICNLYPFAKAKQSGAELAELIENIDIGGPTMIRAAAKNFKYVTVVTDLDDYQDIIQEFKNNSGRISYNTRKNLMNKAFNHTADYDSMIATTMDEQSGILSWRAAYSKGKELRYGENPHQKGYLYKQQGVNGSLYDLQKLNGKEISFNNMVDIQAAIDSVKKLGKHACAVVKHTNPCGLAQAEEQAKALEAAWAGDPVSAFGSIVAFNSELQRQTVEFFHLDGKKSEKKFVEVVIAPAFTDEALEYLQLHKNLRIVKYDPADAISKYDMKFLHGALLKQDVDDKLYEKLVWVTKRKFQLDEELVKFGLIGMCQIKSNSIAIVRRDSHGSLQLLGMGAGQPNRVVSTRLAIQKCKENLAREHNGENLEAYFKEQFSKCILVSDAFFPFPDSIEEAHQVGIEIIVQPGGSIRDKKVIKCCDELEVGMLFTGIRHFRH
ncbi:MAG: phosphoribosylaminoimidazolecarboxamide formyltransferase / cyclohydrolase [Candidatus Cloacimonadota bacterium]|jgi:phosphoribosylaminoimidazolecarboxamide formyltransferase/IMP cyclohydrolase|nr:phosphoribosylaminoimidazolecarboxamide formyltransferase / cyclohydrolase [Candidatus Cloacimonadota bacterium]